jgi:DinB superfamily
MSKTSLAVEQVLSILTETPRRIADATEGLEPDQLIAMPDSGGWSLNEVLGHLRACADVWGGCIQTILAEDRPTIRAIDPRTWIKRTDYRAQPFRVSFQAFEEQRKDLLAVLAPLRPEGWSRSATVTGAGAVLGRTVLTYAEWMARHERSHYRQIRETAAAVAARPGPGSRPSITMVKPSSITAGGRGLPRRPPGAPARRRRGSA